MGDRALLLAPPLLTVLVIALGLRIGASQEARAAFVHGAPPSKARHGLAWTITLVREDRGVDEPVAGEPLLVTARRAGADAVRWEGTTNADGIAEAWLALEGAAPGDRVDLRISSPRDGAVFAHGPAIVPAGAHAAPAGPPSFLPPSHRGGTIALDVLPVDGAIAAEFPARVLVHATDTASGGPLARVRIAVDPEPGLEVLEPAMVLCPNGWSSFRATARAHVVGVSLRAEDPTGPTGEWYGAIPVAGGALFASVPIEMRANAPAEIRVQSPTPRPFAYVEADDDQGRAFAQVVDLLPDPTGMRGGRFSLPPLPPSAGFVVASGSPHGAEELTGPTLAFPFFAVSDADAARTSDCDTLPLLANRKPNGFPRSLVLSGLTAVHASAARARHRGLTLALWTVLVAGLLEALLLLRKARRGRAALVGLPPQLLEGRAGTVAVGVGIALLGFALLAALLLRSAE
ncbi:MAG TPA: hypothetical protein VNO21_19150 [Polyangiaceae bacterium]|nr:hypothetical protein [Polyangiaceae bacterium]